MIQRIQTVYLFIIFGLSISLFAVPLAKFWTTDYHSFQFDVYGIRELTLPNQPLLIKGIPLLALNLLSAVLSLYTVFKFKNRKLQMKMTTFIAFINIALLGLIVYYLKVVIVDNLLLGYYFPILFPALSVILAWLGYRGIKHDDKLVKSYDRIR